MQTCESAIKIVNYAKGKILKEVKEIKKSENSKENIFENYSNLQNLANLYADCLTTIRDLEELRIYCLEQMQKEMGGNANFLL